MTNLPLPFPYVPGAEPVENREFQERVQRNLDALAAAVGSQPLGAAFASYTPSWTATTSNPSIGNGTLTGRWARIGNLIHVTINVVHGTTTTTGTGVYSLSLPVAASANARWILVGDVYDVGTQHWQVEADVAPSGTTTNEIIVERVGASDSAWQHNVPFTMATGDRFTLSGIYEAA